MYLESGVGIAHKTEKSQMTSQFADMALLSFF